MGKLDTQVLVFPRKLVEGCDGFLSWSEANAILRRAAPKAKWLARGEAERSKDWVQPIACAVIRGPRKTYCVLRRIQNTRPDLRARLTLVVGGHVDRPAGRIPKQLRAILLQTLRRELQEEVGLSDIGVANPLGMVFDASSPASARHLAIVYQVSVRMKVKSRAQEEFSSRSKFSGALLTDSELLRFRKNLDPWSSILLQDWIRGSVSDIGRQLSFKATPHLNS